MKSKMMNEYGDDRNRITKEQQQMQNKLKSVQQEMQKKAEEIESTEFSGSYKNFVDVVVKGDKTLVSIDVKDDGLFSVARKQELLDYVVLAANSAFDEVDKVTDREIAEITKGLPIDGLK